MLPNLLVLPDRLHLPTSQPNMRGITWQDVANLAARWTWFILTNATTGFEETRSGSLMIFISRQICRWFGHRRLSSSSITRASNQPLWDESKRFCNSFNGEIFNLSHFVKVLKSGFTFFFAVMIPKCCSNFLFAMVKFVWTKLNGFFLILYLRQTRAEFFLARDR